MTYYQISALVNCLSSLIMGLVVYLKNPRSSLHRTFSFFCLSVGLWSLGYFFWQSSNDANTALLWCRILMACASFISPTFYHFAITLLELEKHPMHKRILRIGYTLATFFLLISGSSLFVKAIEPNRFFELWPKPGILYPLYLLLFFGYALYTWGLMLKKYKHFTGVKRNQIKYILLGTIIGYVGGSTNYPLWYNIPILPVGNCLVTAYVVLIGYAIVKYRLLDIHFVIRKWLTNGILITLTSLIILATYHPSIGLTLKITLGILIASLVVLYIPKLKVGTESKVIDLLYKNKYEYQNELTGFIERMILIPEEDQLSQAIAKTLSEGFGASKVGLWILDPALNHYILRNQIGLDYIEDTPIPHYNPLISWLKIYKKVFLKDENEKKDPSPSGIVQSIYRTLERWKVSICIPVILEKDFMGIIILGEKHSGEMYTHIDIEILHRLGIELAIVLNYKKMEEELRKRRELDLVGLMAGEISHEIMNLLTPIKVFLQLFPTQYQNPEFREEYSVESIKSCDAIRRKVEDMLVYSQGASPRLDKEINLNDPIEKSLNSYQNKLKEKRITLEKKPEPNIKLKADGTLLSLALHHLILNAIEAMEEKAGKLTLTSSLNEKKARITIQDTGKGMNEEQIKKAFTPFITTKNVGGALKGKGMGLGLSIVKKIIDAHKGQIRIQSKVGEGTTVVIDLPIA